MKTIVIWDSCEASICFFVLDGNYEHFNNVYINSTVHSDKVQNELNDLMMDDEGNFKHEQLDDFPLYEMTENNVAVIVAGVIP